MAAIRAVFLDMGWTLAYPRTSMWHIFADLCTEAGVSTTPEACELLVRSLARATHEQAEQQFRSGVEYADSDAEFVDIFGRMGRIIFAQTGVTEDHDELMRRFLQQFWNASNWVCFPEVVEVLRALRARGETRRVPVVILTTSDEEADVIGCYDLGVNSYIRKPVAFDAFNTVVNQLGLYWLVMNTPPPPV